MTSNMPTTTLRISALDTWFFRESRPMEALGGSELDSLFPPPPRTLLGALRTAVGDATGVDWQAFAKDPGHPLHAWIGQGADPGPLALEGPWICWEGRRLYPLPAFVLHQGPEGARTHLRLGIGPP